jgi:hypothetical protein
MRTIRKDNPTWRFSKIISRWRLQKTSQIWYTVHDWTTRNFSLPMTLWLCNTFSWRIFDVIYTRVHWNISNMTLLFVINLTFIPFIDRSLRMRKLLTNTYSFESRIKEFSNKAKLDFFQVLVRTVSRKMITSHI